MSENREPAYDPDKGPTAEQVADSRFLVPSKNRSNRGERERAAFKQREAEAIRPAFMGPPEGAAFCPMCGQAIES